MLSFILVGFLFVHSFAKVPVIIDTDIGTDIDDSWAIAYLLQRPEIDIKLILTDTHNTPERTKLVAKFLDLANRTDIPIGKGIQEDNSTGPVSGALFGWADNYNISNYPGIIYEDGVQALVNMLSSTNETMILLEIAPCPNIHLALKENPGIAKNGVVVAMGGSIDIGYDGNPPPSAEYNIRDNPAASEALYSAGWSIFSAPLDVTVFSQIGGAPYKQIYNSESRITQLLLENYEYWYSHCAWANASGLVKPNPASESSTLHDLVAASLIVNSSFTFQNELFIAINSTGYTNVVGQKWQGNLIKEAISWINLQGWQQYIADSLSQSCGCCIY